MNLWYYYQNIIINIINIVINNIINIMIDIIIIMIDIIIIITVFWRLASQVRPEAQPASPVAQAHLWSGWLGFRPGWASGLAGLASGLSGWPWAGTDGVTEVQIDGKSPIVAGQGNCWPFDAFKQLFS